jgi:hypothetical protein
MSFTKLDYCQYLLSSQINYTLTNLADHLRKWSHRHHKPILERREAHPSLLALRASRAALGAGPTGVPDLRDDTVLDKSFGPSIELTPKQWSGNEKSVVRGIGVVWCVYVNPKTENFWVIDYRIFDPETDGKSKLDHVREMLRSAEHRRVPFRTVLMDSWYAAKDLMLLIDGMGQKKEEEEEEEEEEEKQKTFFYCPLKSNRQVDDSGGKEPYRRVDELEIGAKRSLKKAS